MSRLDDRLLSRVRSQGRASGLTELLDDDQQAIRVAVGTLVASVLFGILLLVVFLLAGEATAAWIAVGWAGLYLSTTFLFLTTGSAQLTLTINLWGSLALAVAVHVALGGYLWSGGIMMVGIGATVFAALYLDPRAAAGLLLVYVVFLIALAPLESSLRQAREQPTLAMSVVVFVLLVLALCGNVVPPVVALIGQARSAQARNRELMLNILPESIADRLKTNPGMIADRFEGCTILFADLVGFTAHSKGKDPKQIVSELNTIFTRFDALTSEHGANKIKTIGDGYMAVAGLPDPDPDHVAHAADLALAMVDAMPALNDQLGADFQVRIGVNSGSVVAGVVGTSKFSYDVWGDTVNLASRLESNGTPGLVVTSAAVAASLHGHYDVEPLGMKDLKGQGPTKIYRLARTHGAAV